MRALLPLASTRASASEPTRAAHQRVDPKVFLATRAFLLTRHIGGAKNHSSSLFTDNAGQMHCCCCSTQRACSLDPQARGPLQYRNGRRHGRHGLLLHRPRERGGGEGGREFVGIHLAIYLSERVLPKSKRSDRGNEPTPRGRLTLLAEPKKRRSARPRRCLQAPRQVSLPRSNGAAGSTWLSAKRGLKTSRTRSRVR